MKAQCQILGAFSVARVEASFSTPCCCVWQRDVLSTYWRHFAEIATTVVFGGGGGGNEFCLLLNFETYVIFT
jgi:hypothetical protein